jgi:predicted TIM-barrel fold metal-dependent hydrolase
VLTLKANHGLLSEVVQRFFAWARPRQFRDVAAEMWAEYADRCTPIGVIPMHTPQEAVAELEHCKSLEIKAVALGSLIRRPIPAAAEQGVSRRYASFGATCWRSTASMIMTLYGARVSNWGIRQLYTPLLRIWDCAIH